MDGRFDFPVLELAALRYGIAAPATSPMERSRLARAIPASVIWISSIT